MARDFAHNAAPSKTPAPSSAASALPVIAIIFVAVICFTAGFWLGAGNDQHTDNQADIDVMKAQLAAKSAEAKIHIARVETLEALVEQWKTKAGEGAHTKVGELQFYKSLPKQSVMPSPVTAKAERKPVSKAAALRHVTNNQPSSISAASVVPVNNSSLDSHPYRIQIASFRHQSDADPVQSKIKRAGFPAFVRSIDLGEKGLWFRVYAGPFVSKAVAENKQIQIEMQMHLKGLLIRGN
ncbi:MAG: SPOR domain-containing protein [Mariprofundus sp.]|nr:SPOR domain-containing protein [Mariprofundus sp.]